MRLLGRPCASSWRASWMILSREAHPKFTPKKKFSFGRKNHTAGFVSSMRTPCWFFYAQSRQWRSGKPKTSNELIISI